MRFENRVLNIKSPTDSEVVSAAATVVVGRERTSGISAAAVVYTECKLNRVAGDTESSVVRRTLNACTRVKPASNVYRILCNIKCKSHKKNSRVSSVRYRSRGLSPVRFFNPPGPLPATSVSVRRRSETAVRTTPHSRPWQYYFTFHTTM